MIKFVLCFLACPLMAFAETEIKITSFVSIESQNLANKGAEVCGTVTQDGSEITKVRVIADPGKYEGHYITQLTSTGRFCQMIRSAFGDVKVTLDTRTEGHSTRARIKR